MFSSRNFVAAAVVVGLVGTGAALRSGSSPAFAGPGASTLTDGTIPDVAERVVDSVVNISSTSMSASPPRSIRSLPIRTRPSSGCPRSASR